MVDNTVEINDDNFEEEVIKRSAKIPVIVDFWAPWCFPCLMLSPILEGLAEENKRRFVLAKLNTEDSPSTSMKYEITAIPCVLLFKNGKIADKFIGALPEHAVREWISKNIG